MRTTVRPTTSADPGETVEAVLVDMGKALGALRCASSQRLLRLGLSMTHFHVLTLLRHHAAMPMGRLAEVIDASMSSTTGIIDRMEERGLVERVRVPDDRRIVLVRPTDAGRSLVDEVELVKNDVLASAIGRLDPAGRRRVHPGHGGPARRARRRDGGAPRPVRAHRTGPRSRTRRPQARVSRRHARRLRKGSTLESVHIDEAPAHGFGALELTHRAKMEILFAVLLGLFLGALDQTIVSVALPTIVTDLGGQSLLTWTITIYLLTSTISVPFYGKLSDLYGRKPLLLIGITLFLVGSALSGLSQDMTQLILFRGIQGLGAGALFPISLAVIGDLSPRPSAASYQGLSARCSA